ncbi:hypothetical protein NM688_g1690 [Phlebia brevispora]|uniref:Uncharacterized protein n=1 Tax=Phlebia brevispora TaxID=194682 RepID=A0ACC1TAL3_9APHY|nr:hypothetical protein NM688_g1690 [Phlebia brevispora]
MPRPNSRLNKNIDKTLKLSKTILESGKDALQFAPIPGLDAAAGALVTLIGMIQQARGNAEAREKLANQIQELTNIIQNIAENSRGALQGAGREAWGEGPDQVSLSPALQKRINVLVRELEAIRDDADRLRKHNFLSRMLSSKIDAEALKGFQDRLKNATDVFMLGSQTTVEHGVNEIKAMLTPRTDSYDLLKDLKALAVQTSYREEYNKAKSRYLEGTRGSVLDDLERWAVGDGELGQYSVYVLSGVVGTGKSTIAYQFAKRLESRNMLGGTFFFMRGSERFSTTRFVIPTIAYQLAMSRESLCPLIAKASQDHLKRGQYQESNYQLDDLIIKPLNAAAASYVDHLPVIVIIDAIDECAPDDEETLAFLLSNLIPKVQELAFPLRILITTRPELRIMNTLYFQRFHQVKLHEIPRPSVDSDIAHYFETGLSHFIYREAFIAKRPAAIRQLTEASEGLFIYASTALDFITKNVDRPDQAVRNLDALLSAKDSGIGSHLDQLYLSVLISVFPTHVLEQNNYGAQVLDVLGAIALLQDPVSPNTLQALTGIKISVTQGVLKRLGSLVIADDNPDGEIRHLHASFPQFLIDRSRCADHSFYVDPTSYHGSLAMRCLELITVKDALRSDRRQTPHAKYSCMHWATHLSLAGPMQGLSGLLVTFLHNNLLLWYETLSDIGRLEIAVPALIRTQPVDDRGGQTLALLSDAYRFILQFFNPIALDPKHIYVSALPLTPHCALLDTYGPSNSLDATVCVTTKRECHWGPCLRVMEGHNSAIPSIQFSPDGRYIVSGSGDTTIKIWDAESGILLNTMEGHGGWVHSVVFNPNMNTKQIASVSNDRTLRIWDLSSGAELRKIQLEVRYNSVAYSPDLDSEQILLGSDSGPPCLRDASDGTLLATLVNEPQTPQTSHTSSSPAIAFSPDGSLLATTFANQVILWNARNHELITSLAGHGSKVTSVAFAQDDKRIISGGNDGTLRIWRADSGICLEVLGGHNDRISCVAVSAMLIASGASDGIRLWDASSYTLTRVLNYPNIRSLSFSPDGDRLLSSSRGKTLCLWDTSSNQAQGKTASSGHKRAVTCVIFSGDGALIATGSLDDTVAIWETKTGELLHLTLLEESSDDLRKTALFFRPIEHITFSPDKKQLAFKDANNFIHVLDVKSGKNTRLRHPVSASVHAQVIVTVYSPDGEWLSAGFESWIRQPGGSAGTTIVCLWRTSDGLLHKNICIDPGAGDHLADLEFSPDSTRLRINMKSRCNYIYAVKTGDPLGEPEYDWESASKPVAPFEEKNGWITLTETKKKLCWIPESKRSNPHRAGTYASYGAYYVTGSETGEVTIFDLSKLVDK